MATSPTPVFLRYLLPLSEEREANEGFFALGKLLYIDREEARFSLTVLPNLKGNLRQPFSLHINASLKLLENLPQKGAGLRVWGELKPLSLRLMVKRVEVVALPPTSWTEAAASKEEPVT